MWRPDEMKSGEITSTTSSAAISVSTSCDRCCKTSRNNARSQVQAGRYWAPGRLSLWYFLMADLSVLRPRVALRVRLPTMSLPRLSTNAP